MCDRGESAGKSPTAAPGYDGRMRSSTSTWVALGLLGAFPAHAQDPPYSATYEVAMKGEPIGVADLESGIQQPSRDEVDIQTPLATLGGGA